MTTTHTSQERAVMLMRMRKASDCFYQQAVDIDCHPFIEFTGLMNEYIKLCEWAHADGIDFASCNVHNGQQLPMPYFSAAYINEKLKCIFTGRTAKSETDSSANNTMETEPGKPWGWWLSEDVRLEKERIKK